ncbi:MAG: RNA-splicing ligase RtcB [Acidobacteria bacterium RIFCSPLOWO2_12_FULL_65_11]|nr:MAG: RNA-splicing ligase RtcB [Acidobacteria bacterium RIFCSPLOWO2_02_FULL_64_15]OFW28887.1 MAG: RNA-splicing ligase RtcB [Acidobacteria bacterium RIFCSPLOWO2_12_FULL_65_11]
MDLSLLTRKSDVEWWIEPHGRMRVPGIIYASEALVQDMDAKVYEQVMNVATLPGIERASYAMPDAHWGYGFPIGGVAAFDADRGGVVSAGGVGFDISCGVRLLSTGLTTDVVEPLKKRLADELSRSVPAGVGSVGRIHLDSGEMDAMLAGGARWAVDRGYGAPADLERIEEHGCMAGAMPEEVSTHAKNRQRDEMGTLGSGNHYLEVQHVVKIFDAAVAAAFALREGDVVISIHCGSRGLGHQIGTEFLKRMVLDAPTYGIELPDRELACAPIDSPLGQAYLGAMRAAINCALANREIITHLVRRAFSDVVPRAELTLLYDVSHNTCKVESHQIDGRTKRLFVHRKGATRAFGPGHPDLPPVFSSIGQPVLIGGTMGTASYVLSGASTSELRSLGSSCHGAGRSMSRHQAARQWRGRQIIDELAGRGILIRSPSSRGVAEEAPGAYKDVTAVVDAAEGAGLSRKVARLEPIVCVKG